MHTNGKWRLWVICILAFVLIGFAFVLRSAYAADTCGDSNEDLASFLETFQTPKVNELLKVKEHGRVKAVIYDREDLGLCIAIFERKLLGTRWKYTGMDVLVESGLQIEGSWHNTGISGSKCEIVICGDNRDGNIRAYAMTDYKHAIRDDLGTDFIIDIYIADGVSELPTGLQQYTSDGLIYDEES